MRKTILDRYEKTEEGKIIIDVSVKTVEHLYSNFDRTAHYLKKDLDEDLVDYLTNSVREVQKYPFVIRFSFVHLPDEPVMDRVRNSIRNFYTYLQELERKTLRDIVRRSAILFVIGIVFLAMAVQTARMFREDYDILAEVFVQGLTIAAWVSLWEAIANIFLEWHDPRRNISLYSKVVEAPVIFRRI